jgi:hypothetical protein
MHVIFINSNGIYIIKILYDVKQNVSKFKILITYSGDNSFRLRFSGDVSASKLA